MDLAASFLRRIVNICKRKTEEHNSAKDRLTKAIAPGGGGALGKGAVNERRGLKADAWGTAATGGEANLQLDFAGVI